VEMVFGMTELVKQHIQGAEVEREGGERDGHTSCSLVGSEWIAEAPMSGFVATSAAGSSSTLPAMLGVCGAQGGGLWSFATNYGLGRGDGAC
jgi:hypothetical protein